MSVPRIGERVRVLPSHVSRLDEIVPGVYAGYKPLVGPTLALPTACSFAKSYKQYSLMLTCPHPFRMPDEGTHCHFVAISCKYKSTYGTLLINSWLTLSWACRGASACGVESLRQASRRSAKRARSRLRAVCDSSNVHVLPSLFYLRRIGCGRCCGAWISGGAKSGAKLASAQNLPDIKKSSHR